MWYVHDKSRTIVATCSEQPDTDDLKARGELAFQCDDQLELGWRVRFGKRGKPIGAEPVEPPASM